jgi:hypothetical protein
MILSIRLHTVHALVIICLFPATSQEQEAREAYVTLLTSIEFAQGAIVMARVLQSFPQHGGGEERPFLALVYDDLLRVKGGAEMRQMLETEQIQIIPVPWIGRVLGLSIHSYPQYETTYMKLHLWNLTGYDTLLYLDSDVLPLAPLTPLFNRTISASTIAAAPDISLPDSFNAGVSVPALHVLELYLCITLACSSEVLANFEAGNGD